MEEDLCIGHMLRSINKIQAAVASLME